MNQARFAVVAIGRNEGERLKRCLESLVGIADQIVYVDSGSRDTSVEMARAMGVEVVRLDRRVPFTAARARNEGFGRLSELLPNLRYVQFIDGDCEIIEGWIDAAVEFLDANPDVAVVCGRRRERHPRRSIYNLLCDVEWDTPVGEARACGGDALVRVDAFRMVCGYSPGLTAGEEPELCVRLRAAGWRIWRLDREMTLHDAAMIHFGQWWMRTLRGGYAFAQSADLHGRAPARLGVRESRSAWFWGLGIPLCVVGFAIWWGMWAFALLLIYPMQVVRLALRGRRSARENWWRAVFLVLGKFPEMLGNIKFLFHRHLGGQSRLIEYK